MKKYLMNGAAVVMLLGVASGCSHDEGSSLYSEVQSNYIEAFNRTFGTPADDQDWGFGDVTASASRMTRAITPDYDFSAAIPSKPTTTEMADANFKENANGIDLYPTNTGSGTYKIDPSVKAVNFYMGGTLYVTGDCDYTADGTSFYANTSVIYLTKGSHLTLNNGFQANSKVYIAEDATLTIKNAITTGNVSYYVKGGTIEAQSSMVVNGGKEFFVEDGTVTVGGELQVENATYYAKNTPLTVNGRLNLIARTNPALFYNEGGIINCTGQLLNNSSKFYTSANSTFANISVNGVAVVYNGANATMNSSAEIRVTTSNGNGTDGSVFINDGTLTATYLGTEGGAFFENNGTATITSATNGYTVVNSNNNTWVNNGTFNTKYFVYNAGSSQVINNCRMNVSEDFDINLADNSGDCSFRMDSDAGVVTKNFNAGGGFSFNNTNFTGGPFYIYMNSGSVFEVTGTATINATKANYGIYNLGNDWAVFHANKIQGMAGQENQGFKVTYGGSKLAVISETTHFPQGDDGNGDHPYIDFKDGCSVANIFASNFNTTLPGIDIVPSRCNPGFSSTGKKWADVRIIAEDLTAQQGSDFDFNDVVFDVTFTSETTATITLLAAGGTLPITVAGQNVHTLFDAAEREMINTNAPEKDGGVVRDPVSFDITGISRANNGKDIEILVKKGDTWEPLLANKGVAAAKIAVKPNFEWCDEYQGIEVKYPQFKQWVQNKNVIWYE